MNYLGEVIKIKVLFKYLIFIYVFIISFFWDLFIFVVNLVLVLSLDGFFWREGESVLCGCMMGNILVNVKWKIFEWMFEKYLRIF